jgi:hypothetical protein
MPRLDLISRPQPFLGIVLVSAGWALSHQLGSNSVFDNCASSGGVVVVLASLLGLVAVAIGGLYCLPSAQHAAGSGRRFLGILGALLALIAGFAIVLQIAAGLILPPCAA